MRGQIGVLNHRVGAVGALAGSVLTYFGFIHGAKLGVGESAGVALDYLLFAVIRWRLAKRAGAPQIQGGGPPSLAAEGLRLQGSGETWPTAACASNQPRPGRRGRNRGGGGWQAPGP